TWLLTSPGKVVEARAGVVEPEGWNGWALVCAIPTDEAERALCPMRVELVYRMPLPAGPGSREYMPGPTQVVASLNRAQAETVVREGVPMGLVRLFEPHVPVGLRPTITSSGVFENM